MENNSTNPNAGQGMGIAALVLGIVAVIAAFIPCLGLIAILFGVLAIIFGAVGFSQAKKENASLTMPRVGLILGIVATGFVIIWMLVIVGSIGSFALSKKDELNKILDSVKVETKKYEDSIKVELDKEKDSIKTIEGSN